MTRDSAVNTEPPYPLTLGSLWPAVVVVGCIVAAAAVLLLELLT